MRRDLHTRSAAGYQILDGRHSNEKHARYRRADNDRIDIKRITPGQEPAQDVQDDDTSWLDAEVRSSSDRPFDTLEPWDEVIRYKSFAGVMMQFAVPASVIDRIESQQGSLHQMKGAPGVKVEVGTSLSKTTKDGSTVDVKSVLASGTFKEIQNLRRLIRSYLNTNIEEVNAAQDLPQQDESPPDVEKGWILKFKWVKGPIDKLRAETMFTVTQWARINKLMSEEQIREATGARFSTKDGFVRRTDDERFFYLVISGSKPQIEQALQMLEGLNTRVVSEEITVDDIDPDMPLLQDSPVSSGEQSSLTPPSSSPSSHEDNLQMSGLRQGESQTPLTSQNLTSIIYVPESGQPDGRKSMWDEVSQLFRTSRLKNQGARLLGLFVLIAPNDSIDKTVTDVQSRVNSYCDRNKIPRVFIRCEKYEQGGAARGSISNAKSPLPDSQDMSSSLTGTPSHSSSNEYFVTIALPGNLDPELRKRILAMSIGEGGTALKNFQRFTGCRIRADRDSGFYKVIGPALALPEASRRLQDALDNHFKRIGLDKPRLRRIGPLAPNDGRRPMIIPTETRLHFGNEPIGERAVKNAEAVNEDATSHGARIAGDERNQSEDSVGAEAHYLKVKVPARPSKDKPFDLRAKVEGSPSLKRISYQTGCRIDLNYNRNVFQFWGTKASIQDARDSLQHRISAMCTTEQIAPVQLEDIVPLTPFAKHDEEMQAQCTEDVKLALRTLTHPVVLITSAVRRDETPIDRGLKFSRGVTVSSFNTITLTPKPIISFNLRIPSRTWDALVDSNLLCVHILSASPEGAAVAHAFTQPYGRPSEPFERLSQNGAFIATSFLKSSLLMRPPLVARDGVLCYINAKLMREKCVEAGDHVVVVAEVTRVRFPWDENGELWRSALEEADGLAYARREYRGVGTAVEPLEIPKLEVSKVGDGQNVENTAEKKDEEATTLDDKNGTEINVKKDAQMRNEDQDDALETDEYFENFANIHNEVDRSTPIAVSAEGHGPSSREVTNSDSATSGLESGEDVAARYFESAQTDGTDDLDSPTRNGRSSAAPIRTHDSRNGFAKPSEARARGDLLLKSFYSTFARPSSRLYSTGSSGSMSYSAEEPAFPDERNERSLSSQVSDLELLSSSVADFLGVPDEPVRPPRMRAIIRAKQQAADASRRLEKALADGTLTTEESAHLEDVITCNERRVAKKLALQSAYDLRRMLDRGRVGDRRAQWLETSIEKGQAVLLEEAKQLRSMLERGVIGRERFLLVKEKLEEQNGILSTEAMRLRQMVDEEGDGGTTPVDGAADESRGFDGFKGNV